MRRIDPSEIDAAQFWFQALSDEVLLKRKLARVGGEARPHRLVGHRKQASLDVKSAGHFERRLGQRAASTQHVGAQKVSGQVFVAEPEPWRLTDPREHVEDVEGILLDPVAGFVFEHAPESRDGAVDVGTDQETPELVVICRVRDYGQLHVGRNRLDPCRQRSATRTTGEDDHFHRKRSSPSGRMRSRPLPFPRMLVPRTITAGVRAVFPIKIPAADARSSAMASTVAVRGLPSSSRLPRRSSAAGRPEIPNATLTMPSLQGRPKVSEMMTPTSAPTSSRNHKQKRRALASGSTGSKVTALRSPTLE